VLPERQVSCFKCELFIVGCYDTEKVAAKEDVPSLHDAYLLEGKPKGAAQHA
jgi:hypothetical protein